MGDETWRPLFQDDEESVRKYDALAENIPPWLKASVTLWITQRVAGQTHVLRTIERHLRITFDWVQVRDFGAMTALLRTLPSAKQQLRLIDFLLADLQADVIGNRPAADELQVLLTQGGSAWAVGERIPGSLGLVRRVPEGVQVAAEQSFSLGPAGQLLKQAWGNAYGLQPNASSAYRDAVRAAEAAATPVVSPKNLKGTLGTVIRDMEQQDRKSVV